MERTRIDIERLVHNKILGIITPEEEMLLNEWLKEKNHQESFDHLMNACQLADRYAHYASVDAEKGWKKFVESEDIRSEDIRSERIWGKRLRVANLLKYAAAILVLLVAGVGYWYSQYTKVTPPEISEAVQLAMQQSIQSGKQEAESEKLRVKSEESELSEELRESEELRVKSEESLGKTNSEDLPANNFSHSFNNSSSLFTLHSSLNISSSLTKDQLLAAKRITTKHDKEFWITLDDGTLVHLNYNTRLIYPEKFGRGNRNVILDGEAYFMVAKDRSRPFIVHTPNGDVKVYGTEFNVNTRTEVRGKKIRGERSASGAENTSLSTAVVLVKGSVSVTPTGSKEIMLKPNQQATVNGQRSAVNGQRSTVNGQRSMVNGQRLTVNVENVDVEPYVAWNEGKFFFHAWTLERVMSVMSHWYGYKIEFESDNLRQLTLNGNFSRYDEIENITEAIGKVLNIDIKIHKNNIFIYNK